MHRELSHLYFDGDVVVQLSLNGTRQCAKKDPDNCIPRQISQYWS